MKLRAFVTFLVTSFFVVTLHAADGPSIRNSPDFITVHAATSFKGVVKEDRIFEYVDSTFRKASVKTVLYSDYQKSDDLYWILINFIDDTGSGPSRLQMWFSSEHDAKWMFRKLNEYLNVGTGPEERP